jgi:hypothetical protein
MNKFGKPSPALFHGAGHAEKVAGPSSTSSAPPAAPVDKPIDTTGLTPNDATNGTNGTNRTDRTSPTSGSDTKTGDSSKPQLQSLLGQGQETTPPEAANDSECSEGSEGAGKSENGDLMQMLKLLLEMILQLITGKKGEEKAESGEGSPEAPSKAAGGGGNSAPAATPPAEGSTPPPGNSGGGKGSGADIGNNASGGTQNAQGSNATPGNNASNPTGGGDGGGTGNVAEGKGGTPAADGGHGAGHTATDPLSSHGGKEPTDLGNGGTTFEPETSAHHNSPFGTKLNSGNVEAIADKMGIDYNAKINDIKNDDSVFLENNPLEERDAGANLVLNSAMQFKSLQADGASDKEILQNAATAKKLAVAGDEEGLEKFMQENGNSDVKLSGKEYVALFEPSEHGYNHPILESTKNSDPALNAENTTGYPFKGHDYFHMTHLTSLNTAPGSGTAWHGDQNNPETMGGFNDGGAYLQLGTEAATVAAMERSLEKLGI